MLNKIDPFAKFLDQIITWFFYVELERFCLMHACYVSFWPVLGLQTYPFSLDVSHKTL